jgi:hypothetical protein
MNEFRYTCSETYRDQSYDYSTPSYEDSTYTSSENCSDADNDGYCDGSGDYGSEYESEYSEDIAG